MSSDNIMDHGVENEQLGWLSASADGGISSSNFDELYVSASCTVIISHYQFWHLVIQNQVIDLPSDYFETFELQSTQPAIEVGMA